MPGRQPKKQHPKGLLRSQKLMDVAIDLFAERGYNSVTINEITKKSNVTHSLVYYHFKNKEELFNHAVKNLIDNNIRHYQENHENHTDPVELLEDWFQFNIDHATVMMKLVRIMFDCSLPSTDNPIANKAIRHFYEQEHKILSENIHLGIKKKKFKDVDPDGIASFISTHIDGIFYGKWTQQNFNIEKEMHRMKMLLWDFILLDK